MTKQIATAGGAQPPTRALSPLTELSFTERLTGLLTNEAIDWQGRLEFDADGVPCRARDGGRVNLMMRPLPQIGPKTQGEAADAEAHLERVLAPARPDEFVALLTRLAIHFPQQYRDPALVKPMIEDYRKDVGHLPAWLLEQVCDEYRMRADSQWFPRSRQLYDLAYPHWRKLKTLHERARIVQGKPGNEAGVRSQTAAGERTLASVLSALPSPKPPAPQREMAEQDA